jgi:ATP-dependent Clp protease adaptor protein ClpS
VAIPETITREETKLYPRYRVFVHNDDVTPMELVVHVLLRIFGLDMARATAVMLEAHHTGVAFVIALTLEQAEFRVEQAHSLARGAGYPLTFTYEPE